MGSALLFIYAPFYSTMKTRFATLALLLFPFIFNSSAEAQTPKSLLWEISGNGLQEPSYLYGTMHVGDKRAYKFSKSVMPSFEKATSFAMELDPTQANPVALMNLMKLDSGTLHDVLTPEEWNKLDAYMQEKLNTPLENFKEYGPFFIYSMVAQTQFKNQKGQALDLYFFKQAKKGKKDIHGLETVEEQMGAINRMPLEDQKKMLMDAIDGKDEGQGDMDKMLKYYSKGDLDMLQQMADEADYGSEFESALITERNHIMAERLEPLIKEQSTFIAVGALHLPGDEGILKILQEDGYTVKPLK